MPLPTKQLNVKQSQDAKRKNSSMYLVDTDQIVESQAEYIDNLQQQIFLLDSEIGYLKTHLIECNKHHPSMVAEGEKMVKKLAEHQKEIQYTKIELKKKQTTIDLLCSEKDRVSRYSEELEEKVCQEKGALLEELVARRKEFDVLAENQSKSERLLQEQKQKERSLQEDMDNLRIEMEQIKREWARDKDLINGLKESKEKLQAELFEVKAINESKDAQKREEAIKELKSKIEEAEEQMEMIQQTSEHERLLRTRLSEDNAQLIKRHAQLEAELAEIKATLREEQSLRASLEQVHLSTVLETAEAKSRDASLKEEIERLGTVYKEENQHSLKLALQLSEEQRFKMREEEKCVHLQERFEQLEQRMASREKENTQLARDNTYQKDQISHLKQQLQSRDQEVYCLKQKVQEMQVSVEEFIQSNHAASRIAGERWKQLQQLAQGIQALTLSSPTN